MNINEVLSHFENVKKNGSQYQCRCPSHADDKASLSICEKNGKILLHCHAGCNTADILSSVGLAFEDIGSKKKSYKWRERLEYTTKKHIEAVYPYYDENGKYQYSKIRFEGKEIRYAVIDEKSDSYTMGKGGGKDTLYRLSQLIQAIGKGYPVYIVEGEKDADRLSKLGYTATTAGSANDWKPEYSRFFKGAKVYILPDNDKPGMDLCRQIQRDLKPFAYYSVYTLTSLQEKGDVSDYLDEGHTMEDVKHLIDESKKDPDHISWATWVYSDRNKPQVNPDLLADAFEKTTDYIQIRNSNDDKEDIYIFNNGVYELHSTNMLEGEIRKFIPLGICSPDTLTKTRKLLMTKSCHIKSF
ncbi:MAG: DNA primase, partial [Clostridia bacterium]|nr:DNA primase [Clostridia bacterium]